MITKETFRQKAKEGSFSEEETSQIEYALESIAQRRKSSGGFSSILKDFFKGYNAPRIWNQAAESVLILCIIIGIIILGYFGKLEPIIISAFMATIIGFIFGKMR